MGLCRAPSPCVESGVFSKRRSSKGRINVYGRWGFLLGLLSENSIGFHVIPAGESHGKDMQDDTEHALI